MALRGRGLGTAWGGGRKKQTSFTLDFGFGEGRQRSNMGQREFWLL